jgi:hypothetical protein
MSEETFMTHARRASAERHIRLSQAAAAMGAVVQGSLQASMAPCGMEAQP